MAIGLIFIFRLILLDEQVKTVILKFKKMAVIRYFVSVLNRVIVLLLRELIFCLFDLETSKLSQEKFNYGLKVLKP